MKEAVLIGAGQTGRGFIAPILQANAYHITFIDKNKELIDQLNAEKSYTCLLYTSTHPPQHCKYPTHPRIMRNDRRIHH